MLRLTSLRHGSMCARFCRSHTFVSPSAAVAPRLAAAPASPVRSHTFRIRANSGSTAASSHSQNGGGKGEDDNLLLSSFWEDEEDQEDITIAYRLYGREHTYKLEVLYDGTNYAGWQLQPKHKTIQGELEKVLEKFTGCDRKMLGVTGCGRTDSGVHALKQVCHFYTDKKLDTRKTFTALNGMLPFEIRIHYVAEVDRTFHARYSALSKTYHYLIHTDPILDPFTRQYRLHIWWPMNLEELREAASYFVGTHDFSAFANRVRNGVERDPVRTITRFDIIEIERGIRIEIESSGFLYKQVRNMVGALLPIADGKLPPSHILELMASKDRDLGPPGARAKGLYLADVVYPPHNIEVPLGDNEYPPGGDTYKHLSPKRATDRAARRAERAKAS